MKKLAIAVIVLFMNMLVPAGNWPMVEILNFFQNLKELKHKGTKTLRHKEVYRMPFIIRETPSIT
jgi:hypothetical protein